MAAPETPVQELSRRARTELNKPCRVTDENGNRYIKNHTNYVSLGHVRINRNTDGFSVLGAVEVAPATWANVITILSESWKGEVIRRGTRKQIMRALDLLRKCQILDDIANV